MHACHIIYVGLILPVLLGCLCACTNIEIPWAKMQRFYESYAASWCMFIRHKLTEASPTRLNKRVWCNSMSMQRSDHSYISMYWYLFTFSALHTFIIKGVAWGKIIFFSRREVRQGCSHCFCGFFWRSGHLPSTGWTDPRPWHWNTEYEIDMCDFLSVTDVLYLNLLLLPDTSHV